MISLIIVTEDIDNSILIELVNHAKQLKHCCGFDYKSCHLVYLETHSVLYCHSGLLSC